MHNLYLFSHHGPHDAPLEQTEANNTSLLFVLVVTSVVAIAIGYILATKVVKTKAAKNKKEEK